jgi:hypothetical protein
VFFLRFAGPTRPKAAHQVNRDLRRIETTFAVTEANKRFECFSIAANCGLFQAACLAIREITGNGFIQGLAPVIFPLSLGVSI